MAACWRQYIPWARASVSPSSPRCSSAPEAPSRSSPPGQPVKGTYEEGLHALAGRAARVAGLRDPNNTWPSRSAWASWASRFTDVRRVHNQVSGGAPPVEQHEFPRSISSPIGWVRRFICKRYGDEKTDAAYGVSALARRGCGGGVTYAGVCGPIRRWPRCRRGSRESEPGPPAAAETSGAEGVPAAGERTACDVLALGDASGTGVRASAYGPGLRPHRGAGRCEAAFPADAPAHRPRHRPGPVKHKGES